MTPAAPQVGLGRGGGSATSRNNGWVSHVYPPPCFWGGWTSRRRNTPIRESDAILVTFQKSNRVRCSVKCNRRKRKRSTVPCFFSLLLVLRCWCVLTRQLMDRSENHCGPSVYTMIYVPLRHLSSGAIRTIKYLLHISMYRTRPTSSVLTHSRLLRTVTITSYLSRISKVPTGLKRKGSILRGRVWIHHSICESFQVKKFLA